MTLLPVRLQAMQHISLQCPALRFPSHSCFSFYPPQQFLHFKNKKGKETQRQGNGWQEDMRLLTRNVSYRYTLMTSFSLASIYAWAI